MKLFSDTRRSFSDVQTAILITLHIALVGLLRQLAGMGVIFDIVGVEADSPKSLGKYLSVTLLLQGGTDINNRTAAAFMTAGAIALQAKAMGLQLNVQFDESDDIYPEIFMVITLVGPEIDAPPSPLSPTLPAIEDAAIATAATLAADSDDADPQCSEDPAPEPAAEASGCSSDVSATSGV